VYTLSGAGPEAGEPKPVELKPGITDGRFTQVAGGELKEGQLVVVGLVTAKADASSTRNPMAPGMPGGPGGGRRF
jgi:hypothetical protein